MHNPPKSRRRDEWSTRTAKPRRAWGNFPIVEEDDIPMDGDPTILVSAEQLAVLQAAHPRNGVFDKAHGGRRSDDELRRSVKP